MESNSNTPLEHQNVPTAHQGLHSFLYSSDSEHSADSSSAATIDADGTSIVELLTWSEQTANTKVAGVYAILDRDRTYQFVSYSRDVLRSAKSHIAQHGEQLCTYIRVKSYKFPKRQAMTLERDEWIAALDYIPQGNQSDGDAWASTIGAAAKATMTEAEKNAYEEKKLKLRKAMADATLVDELAAQDNQSNAEVLRRQQLEAAVKNDDWSSVIDAQST